MSNIYRHEQKYICSSAQIKHLFKLVSTILATDTHYNGSYHVKSLYFDTKCNRFLQESLNGVSERSKYRLRRYNHEKEKIKFECKSSFFHLKRKRFIWVDQKEIPIIKDSKLLTDNQLLNEFYCLKRIEQIEPKIIIDYDRTAFVHKNLNVRITLDQKIICSDNVNMFLDDNLFGKDILANNAGILEVKFDDVLPSYIIQVLGLEDLEQTTFSKYVMGCLAYKKVVNYSTILENL